jgi:hypothetical protein
MIKFLSLPRLALAMATGIATVAGLLLCAPRLDAQGLSYSWNGYGHDPQHTAISQNASQPLDAIRWTAKVDDAPPYSSRGLLIHYGSPLITQANTVIIPVRNASNQFRIEARKGSDGSLIWKQDSDYVLPPYRWVPPFNPVITPRGKLAYPSIGGVVTVRDSPDAAVASTTKYCFYSADPTKFNSAVRISSPITTDRFGNMYFSYYVTDGSLTLKSGIARISFTGAGSYVTAAVASGDPNANHFAFNCAPALSRDHSLLYICATDGGTNAAYLLALNARTLETVSKAPLRDVNHPERFSWISDDGTASPTVGPDGDVYYGVLENWPGSNNYRGWLQHFSADLKQRKTSGAFGWDDTASIVPRALVPSYKGTSSYLVMVKYNNYVEGGGDGVNRIALLDPNATQTDKISGATVMREVITVAGPTPDTEFLANHPNAVREWCINTAAVDPFNKCILANCEDGVLYRWDLTTNTLSQRIRLTGGIGEAYTPTVIGVDGTVYAINNANLYAVGYR